MELTTKLCIWVTPFLLPPSTFTDPLIPLQENIFWNFIIIILPLLKRHCIPHKLFLLRYPMFFFCYLLVFLIIHWIFLLFFCLPFFYPFIFFHIFSHRLYFSPPPRYKKNIFQNIHYCSMYPNSRKDLHYCPLYQMLDLPCRGGNNGHDQNHCNVGMSFRSEKGILTLKLLVFLADRNINV